MAEMNTDGCRHVSTRTRSEQQQLSACIDEVEHAVVQRRITVVVGEVEIGAGDDQMSERAGLGHRARKMSGSATLIVARIDIDASDLAEHFEHAFVALAPHRQVARCATIAVTNGLRLIRVFEHEQSNDVGADGGGETSRIVVSWHAGGNCGVDEQHQHPLVHTLNRNGDWRFADVISHQHVVDHGGVTSRTARRHADSRRLLTSSIFAPASSK